MKTVLALLLLTTGATLAHGQAIITLDDFGSGSANPFRGSALTLSSPNTAFSWVLGSTVTQTSSDITVNAPDVNGWGASNLSGGSVINATGMNYIALTAKKSGAGAGVSHVVVELIDINSVSVVFSIPTTSFTTTYTTLYFPINLSGIASAHITDWTIGGGSATGGGTLTMSFDNLALTASAIPEPSTYAALGGAFALVAAAWRRKFRSVV